MKNIMSLLFNTKIETTEQIGVERFSLIAKDKRVTGLITTASKIMYQVEEMLKEDIQQEVALMLIKYTKTFSMKHNISLEAIYNALQEEESKLAAQYWGYIKLCNAGHFKKIKVEKLLDKENNEYFYKENVQLISELKVKDYAGLDALEFILLKQNRLEAENKGVDNMSSNHFVNWCRENAKEVLTKKQYKRFTADPTFKDTNGGRTDNSIATRLLDAYSKDFNIESKNNERESKIAILNSLIKSNDLSLYRKISLKHDFISNAVYTSKTTTDTAKYFTAIINNKAEYSKLKLDRIKLLLIRERNKITKNL